MPTLNDIRAHVASLIDYDPNNEVYKTELSRLINSSYQRIWSARPWNFAQKEVTVLARADVDVVISASANSTAIGHSNTLQSYMAGQIIEIGGTEYTIAYIYSTTVAYLTSEYVGSTGSYTATVKFRYLDLPQDMVSILQMSMRTKEVSSIIDSGPIVSLTRAEETLYNYALDEQGTPRQYILADSIYVPAPARPPELATRSVSNKGTRTIRCAVAHDWGARYSALSPYTEITLGPTEDIEWSPDTIPNTTGYLRSLWVSFPNDGFKAYYQLGDYTSGVISVDPTGAATLEYDTSTGSSPVNTDRFPLMNTRHVYNGTSQRVRLYPRPEVDTEVTVRYMYQPEPLVEDWDTPYLPEMHHYVLSYLSLSDLLVKVDAASLAMVYEKKADAELNKMETRYLTQESRRIVRGNAYFTGGAYNPWPYGTIVKN